MHGRPTSPAAVRRRTVSKGRRPPQASWTPNGGPHRQQVAAGAFLQPSFVEVGTVALRALEDPVDVEERFHPRGSHHRDNDAEAARKLLVALDAGRKNLRGDGLGI